MANEMQPFRHMLKPGNPIVWTDAINERFEKSQRVITDTIREGVLLFDLNRKNVPPD